MKKEYAKKFPTDCLTCKHHSMDKKHKDLIWCRHTWLPHLSCLTNKIKCVYYEKSGTNYRTNEAPKGIGCRYK